MTNESLTPDYVSLTCYGLHQRLLGDGLRPDRGGARPGPGEGDGRLQDTRPPPGYGGVWHGGGLTGVVDMKYFLEEIVS